MAANGSASVIVSDEPHLLVAHCAGRDASKAVLWYNFNWRNLHRREVHMSEVIKFFGSSQDVLEYAMALGNEQRPGIKGMTKPEALRLLRAGQLRQTLKQRLPNVSNIRAAYTTQPTLLDAQLSPSLKEQHTAEINAIDALKPKPPMKSLAELEKFAPGGSFKCKPTYYR